MLVSLNEGIKSLGRRFDTYQTSVDGKFQKMEAELVLLSNKVDLIEAGQTKL